jgi:hypothetical protein
MLGSNYKTTNRAVLKRFAGSLVGRSDRALVGGKIGLSANQAGATVHMPRDKSSKRLERKISDYKKRPYKNELAIAWFFLNPDLDRAAALTLHGQSDYDRAIKRAFDTFGLDSNITHHRRTLLGILADVLFGERGKGPKIEWDFERYAQLLSDFDEISARLPDLSGQKCFEMLTREEPYSGRYKDWKASTLRARHRDASNPKRNKFLAYIRKDRRAAILERLAKKWKSKMTPAR